MRGHIWQLKQRVFVVYPMLRLTRAREWSPGEVAESDAITIAVIPASRIDPNWHLPVCNDALRADAREVLRGSDRTNSDEPDAVLCFCPVQ